ncbi:MAG: hypothetical protein E6H40_08240 [Betaproteobacteria bacterium]|nr:MAG: hypothetical protein E6H40_08240 [Betaproteobacteria bacterium]
MQRKLFALGLLAFAQGALAADAGEFSLGVGFNYSSGEYGTSTITEILSIPVIARYDHGPWIFKLTIPYLSISGGTSVVPGVGRVTSSNPKRRGDGASEATATGLGDIVASATYTAFYNSATASPISAVSATPSPAARRSSSSTACSMPPPGPATSSTSATAPG